MSLAIEVVVPLALRNNGPGRHAIRDVPLTIVKARSRAATKIRWEGDVAGERLDLEHAFADREWKCQTCRSKIIDGDDAASLTVKSIGSAAAEGR